MIKKIIINIGWGIFTILFWGGWLFLANLELLFKFGN